MRTVYEVVNNAVPITMFDAKTKTKKGVIEASQMLCRGEVIKF